MRHELSKPFLFEHPEQLGAVNDFIPASVWDFDELKHLLLLEGVHTAAFFQCQWGAPSSKPTRFLWYSVPLLGAALHSGAPQLTTEGRYSGPLPASCGHRHARRLLGKSEDNRWNTSSAAYPLPMCRWLAQNLLRLCRVDGGVPTCPGYQSWGLVCASRMCPCRSLSFISRCEPTNVARRPCEFWSGTWGFRAALHCSFFCYALMLVFLARKAGCAPVLTAEHIVR